MQLTFVPAVEVGQHFCKSTKTGYSSSLRIAGLPLRWCFLEITEP
jgi:hypothetical protein